MLVVQNIEVLISELNWLNKLVDKYANLIVKEEKIFSHHLIQIEWKGACKNEGYKKNRISYKCNECDMYLCNVPCFGEYYNLSCI